MVFLALRIKAKPLISAFGTFGYVVVNLLQLTSYLFLPASALLDPAETWQSHLPSTYQAVCSPSFLQLLLSLPFSFTDKKFSV